MNVPHTIGRFLLAGGGNTLLTAVVASSLSLVAPEAIAYTVGYAAGLALSVFTASRFVFRRSLTRARAAGICAVNITAYLCGLGTLTVAQHLGLPSGLTGLTVLVTAPVSFFGGMFIFKNAAELPSRPFGPALKTARATVSAEASPKPRQHAFIAKSAR